MAKKGDDLTIGKAIGRTALGLLGLAVIGLAGHGAYDLISTAIEAPAEEQQEETQTPEDEVVTTPETDEEVTTEAAVMANYAAAIEAACM